MNIEALTSILSAKGVVELKTMDYRKYKSHHVGEAKAKAKTKSTEEEEDGEVIETEAKGGVMEYLIKCVFH